MPAFETMDLYQRAVVWRRIAEVTDAHGEILVEDGEEIAVRWVWQYGEALDPAGETIKWDAGVVVAEDIPDGSIMWPGELGDVGGTAVDLYQVIGRFTTTSINNRWTRRTLMLMRYSDDLPTVGTGGL
jgi:hypothetical protein